MAQYEDITIDQGTDVAIELQLTNPDGSKKDLTGYSVTSQIRRTVNTSDSDAITFTSFVADPYESGIVTLILTNEQTMGLKPPRYFYDVELSHEDSDQVIIEKILHGNLNVNPNITRVEVSTPVGPLPPARLALSALSDTLIDTPSNNDALVWDSDANKWVNTPIDSFTDSDFMVIYNHLTNLDSDIANFTGGYSHPNHTGDVTSVGDGATTISSGVVTNAKLANMPATTIKGNNTGALGVPLDLTPAQVRILINVADGATANSSDATLLNRSNHTGTQAAGTITGLATIATSGSASDLGSGTLPALRFDDTSHGSRSGGTLHATAIAGGAAGFMSGTDKTKLDGITGTNTGDQTSIVGITGTKAQFDTAVTDGNFLYVGDVTQYTDEMAQDAIGVMIDTSLVYVDATPLLQRAALTGDVTAPAGSNTLTIANDAVTYAKMQNAAANSIIARVGTTSGDLTHVQLTASQLIGRGSTGDIAAITLGTNLSFSGATLNAAGLADGDKGDITVSGSGATWTIDAGVITLAKQADVATGTVFYRKTVGTGAPEVQTLATLKTDLGLTGTNSGDQTITLTGDITGSGTGSFATTLATVNSNVGLFGGATAVPAITVNGKGLITAVTSTSIQIAESQVTNLTSDLSAKEATANKDVSGGYAGLTLLKVNMRNVANTFTSFLTNTNTAARTYTFPDKDGTVAMTSDITGTNSGTNTGDVTLVGTPNYITISGQVITRSNIDLTSHVTGKLPFSNIDDVATSSVMYRKTAGTGSMESQTLATLKTDLGLTGTNSGDQTITLTGDVTGSGTGSFSTTIGANTVTLGKMAQLATQTIIGRNTGGTGDPEALSASTVRTILGLATIATSGSASDLGSGTLPAARFDDTAHGSRSGGTLHANVIAGGAAGFMSGTDKTKLDGIDSGATANLSDATLLARANHTGTQLASTISDFSEAVDDRVAALIVAGTNITTSYNDSANTLTINASGGGGSATITEIELDFGSTLVNSKEFTVTDAGVSGTSKIMMVQSGATPTGRSADENQWAVIVCRCNPGSGQFTVWADSLTGSITGPYKFNYIIS